VRRIIANRLRKTGWSLGWVSAVGSEGRTIWIADAHHDGRRFIVHADEKLSIPRSTSTIQIVGTSHEWVTVSRQRRGARRVLIILRDLTKVLRAKYYARRLNFHPIRPKPIIAIPSRTVVEPESGTAPETRSRFTLSRTSPMLLLLPSF
jgi:hypothetical protein